MTDDKSPLDQVIELFVFAPLGLVMTARNQLPDMVAKGRAQLEGQVTLAHFVGRFAVKEGRKQLDKRLAPFTDRSPAPTPPAVASAEAAPEPQVATVAVPLTLLAQPAPSTEPPPVPAADLAIPGYDALSASQVVQRLAGLSPAELEQVRTYEAASRGRKTVLTKISQLQ